MLKCPRCRGIPRCSFLRLNRHLRAVSITIVIPGAFGCLLTGLKYSTCSNLDFFKHNWLICKWTISITAILFGTFFLGPWERAMMEISQDNP